MRRSARRVHWEGGLSRGTRTSSGVEQLAFEGVPPGEREFYYEACSAVVLLPGFVGILSETPIVWPPYRCNGCNVHVSSDLDDVTVTSSNNCRVNG